MALRDAMEQTKSPCKAAVILGRLNVEDRETVEEWLTKGFSSMSIARAISTDNPSNKVNDATLRKHFLGECSCPSSAKFSGVLA